MILPLRIIEVSWDCHHCFVTTMTKISFGRLLHFGQNHRRNLLREESFTFGLVLHFQFGFSSIADNLKKSAILELLRSKNNWNSLISEPQKYLKYLNFRAKITYFYLERPMFHVTLDGSILKLPSDQSFGIWKNEYHLDYWSTISSAIYLEMIWTPTFMCGQ